jgi:hypothetical protein
MERTSWEQVLALRTLRMSEHEAEALQTRLLWLTEHLPQMRAQFWGEDEGGV